MFDRVFCVSAKPGIAPFIAFANYIDAYTCAYELDKEDPFSLITQPPLFFSWSSLDELGKEAE